MDPHARFRHCVDPPDLRRVWGDQHNADVREWRHGVRHPLFGDEECICLGRALACPCRRTPSLRSAARELPPDREARVRGRRVRSELRNRGTGVAASCRPPRKTKSSPVFPVVGQLLQRHARHITSNGHSSRWSTVRRIEERERGRAGCGRGVIRAVAFVLCEDRYHARKWTGARSAAG